VRQWSMQGLQPCISDRNSKVLLTLYNYQETRKGSETLVNYEGARSRTYLPRCTPEDVGDVIPGVELGTAKRSVQPQGLFCQPWALQPCLKARSFEMEDKTDECIVCTTERN